MAVLLLFQNHCGTGVQRAENPDGDEWQAFWWTHKLIQSRKTKVLSLFPSSTDGLCPGCDFGFCSAVVAVGLCSGAVWCWVSPAGGAVGGLSPERGQEGPGSPSCLDRDVLPPGCWNGSQQLLALLPQVSEENGAGLFIAQQKHCLPCWPTKQHCWSQGGRAQVTLGQLRPQPSLLAVAVFFQRFSVP